MGGSSVLDEDEAAQESSVLHRPVLAAPYTCWVGGAERLEFIRQSTLMVQMQDGLDMPVDCVVQGQHDHFSVIEGLRDSDGAITQNLLAMTI